MILKLESFPYMSEITSTCFLWVQLFEHLFSLFFTFLI